MDYKILMAAVSALAIGNSVFFGVYLLQSQKESKSNRLLALLLFALALRISKSVIIIVLPRSSEIFPAIGLIGMAAIGPLLFLYIKSLFTRSQNIYAWLHLLPSGFIAATVLFASEETIYRYYQLIVLQILIYLIISFIYLKNNLIEIKANRLRKEWSLRLSGGVFAIWLAFLYQLILDSYVSYIIATSIAVIVLYLLSFWSMQRKKIFSVNFKNENNQQLNRIAKQVKDLFEKEMLYREDDVTLNKVGMKINEQAYLVSRSINEVYKMSFPEFLNSFRIAEARRRLIEDQKQSLSIEAVAYDSGFSTLSSFYSAFKKQVKMTPNEFRKRHLSDVSKG